jgi:glycosyltransferase involved in cell wall biosynthesis
MSGPSIEPSVRQDGHPAVVVIGRNEGERLRVCLSSLRRQCSRIVYVDSGSTDGSLERAAQFGTDVVALDMCTPFSAARARNAGWRRVVSLWPETDWIQFVDGDCELISDWFVAATYYRQSRPELAILYGNVRERYPTASIYNQLCEWEWQTPHGNVLYCGGNAIMRVDVLLAQNGFRDEIIAGEEPEFCVRVRQAGFEIHHIDVAMVLHDAAMLSFGQWTKRAIRSGHAFAEGWHLHGGPPHFHWRHEFMRAMLWGGVVPGLTLLIFAVMYINIGMLSGIGFLIYPIHFIKLIKANSGSTREKMIKAVFQLLVKPFEFLGAVKYFKAAAGSKPRTIIEYKT